MFKHHGPGNCCCIPTPGLYCWADSHYARLRGDNLLILLSPDHALQQRLKWINYLTEDPLYDHVYPMNLQATTTGGLMMLGIDSDGVAGGPLDRRYRLFGVDTSTGRLLWGKRLNNFGATMSAFGHPINQFTSSEITTAPDGGVFIGGEDFGGTSSTVQRYDSGGNLVSVIRPHENPPAPAPSGGWVSSTFTFGVSPLVRIVHCDANDVLWVIMPSTWWERNAAGQFTNLGNWIGARYRATTGALLDWIPDYQGLSVLLAGRYETSGSDISIARLDDRIVVGLNTVGTASPPVPKFYSIGPDTTVTRVMSDLDSFDWSIISNWPGAFPTQLIPLPNNELMLYFHVAVRLSGMHLVSRRVPPNYTPTRSGFTDTTYPPAASSLDRFYQLTWHNTAFTENDRVQWALDSYFETISGYTKDYVLRCGEMNMTTLQGPAAVSNMLLTGLVGLFEKPPLMSAVAFGKPTVQPPGPPAKPVSDPTRYRLPPKNATRNF